MNLTMPLEIIGFLVAALCLFAVALSAIVWAFNYTHEKWLTFHSIETKTRLGAHFSELTIWCGYEFPIMKDINEHIEQGLSVGGYFESPNQFRDKMRRKYGTGKFSPGAHYADAQPSDPRTPAIQP